MDRQLHLLESFVASGSDGKDYKVCGCEQMVPDPTLVDGQPHWQPTGVAEYRLAEGDAVADGADGADGAVRVVRSGVALSRK